MMAQRTIKLKGSNLFSPEKWTTVRQAVEAINKIVLKSTLLSKIYCIQEFGNDNIIALDKDFYDICFKVVMNQALQFRGAIGDLQNQKIGLYNSLMVIFLDVFEGQFVNVGKMSINFILEYASQQLETAMLNNIELHYVKHVNRFLYTYLYNSITDQKSVIAKTRAHLLYDEECPKQLKEWCNQHRHILVPQRHNQSFDIDLIKRHWVYLKHMIQMSKVLEKQFPNTKLLSPIILRRSFIPKHIHIDTNALVQLFMTQKDIEEFVKWYPDPNKTPKLSNKKDLGSSFKMVFGRDPENEEEDFMYQQQFWRFICKWDNPKFQRVLEDRKRGLYFGNSIYTDGCSISFNMVEIKRKKKKQTRQRTFKKDKKDEFLTEYQHDKDTLYLSVDPGKGDLITVTDGYNIFKYTKAQRQIDTKRMYFEKRSLEERRKNVINGTFQTNDSIIPGYYHTVVDPSVAFYEEQILSKYNSKSCDVNRFVDWVRAKLKQEKTIEKTYKVPKLRNYKFSKYVLNMSSEDKMISKLQKFVKKERLTSKMKESNDVIDRMIRSNVDKKDFKNVVMMYGNWGKSPNLKNNEPAPGIGLRRKIHKVIATLTVDEHYTSKTCPCCKGVTLDKAKLRESNVLQKHHLLRCKNEECCSRWWNRNVAGAYNILYKGLKKLRGAPEPP